MKGIELRLDANNTHLEMVIAPMEVERKLDIKALIREVASSEYSQFFLLEENIKKALDSYRDAVANEDSSVITERVAERRDTEVEFTIDSGEMSASLALTAPYGGSIPSLKDLLMQARKSGIKKGLGRKRVAALRQEIANSAPGTKIEGLIAKGLPPKNGRSSKLKPLVPNALERILRPQSAGGTRVDMRNLGDVICVKAGTELLRRMPPTEGRNGFTVTDAELLPKPGEWVKFRAGDGTVISDHDENLLLADINGMPKFKDQKMWVDDTFTCTGVNVGTGNIKYDGAVLVNGDVTEKMTIVAKGDVTINGFVESASIQSGGDIIITEGAMGKVNDANTSYSTTLRADGNVHIQHGQGLDIICNGNVTIGRQLAYSRINCTGGVKVGPIDRPDGNLFACEIQSQGEIEAGTFGAVSGSSLSIDFSAGFNQLLERKDTLDDLLQQIRSNNARHMDKMALIRSKRIHSDLREKFLEAEDKLRNETQLLQWLEQKAQEMKDKKDSYQTEIQLIAHKRLYPGVVVKLNNRTWRADREYGRAKVLYEGHQWVYKPLI